MKLGFVITMYDEFDVVHKTIEHLSNSAHEINIALVHSNNLKSDYHLEYIKSNVNYYTLLEDLSVHYDRFELPSAVICRNYSLGFTELYKIDNFDYVIGMTADTLIYDIDRLLTNLDQEHYGFVLQAVGQHFHGPNDDPKNGVSGSRYQHDLTTDIMPQLFIFNGEIALKYKLFSNIKNNNKFTSEQNLGDTINEYFPDFHNKIKRFHNNSNVYDFNEGVRLQVKGLGHTRMYL